MRLEDRDAMRKTLVQKRKARATSTGSKKVKFIKLESREAPTKPDSLGAIEATLGVAVAAPSSLVAPSALVVRPPSSYALIEGDLAGSSDHELPPEGGSGWWISKTRRSLERFLRGICLQRSWSYGC